MFSWCVFLPAVLPECLIVSNWLFILFYCDWLANKVVWGLPPHHVLSIGFVPSHKSLSDGALETTKQEGVPATAKNASGPRSRGGRPSAPRQGGCGVCGHPDDCGVRVFFLVQHYFTVNFTHENQKALELRTEDAKDCDEWVAAIAHARYASPC